MVAAADVEATARSERELDAMRVKDCRSPSASGTAELATGPDTDAGTRAKRSGKAKGRRARAGKRAGAPKEFTGVHVLVVDDERVNRTVLVSRRRVTAGRAPVLCAAQSHAPRCPVPCTIRSDTAPRLGVLFA